MDLFPDTFQNSFNGTKCVGIMGNYADKCALVYFCLLCCSIPFIESLESIRDITSVFIYCIRINIMPLLI